METHRVPTLFLLLIALSVLIITVSGGKSLIGAAGSSIGRKSRSSNVQPFNRSCTSNENCQFTIGSDTAYLICNNKRKRCACKNDEGWADIAIWDIAWKTRTQECVFGATDKDLECIEQKCRNPQKLRSNLENYSCDGDIDCIDGLICDVVGYEYGEDKRCVKKDKKSS